MTRVLHVGSGHVVGGIERALETMAEAADRCPELASEFAFCFPGATADAISGRGASVRLLGEMSLRRPWTVLEARARLRRLVNASDYDAVLMHGPWCLGLLAPALRGAGARLGLFLHGPASRSRWPEKIAARRRIDFILANGFYVRDESRDAFPNAEIHVCRYPVFVERYAPDRHPGLRRRVREERGAAPDDAVILQVGRMEAWKGHVEMLEALAAMKRQTGWTCWIVGGPQSEGEERYYASLKQARDRLGLGRKVAFLGWQESPLPFYQAADIYCQTNREPEPFGIVFIEAMASGLPVVAANEGGVCESVTPDCGRLVKRGDPSQAAAALEALVASRALRERLGAAGIQRAREMCDPGPQLEALRRRCAAAS